MRILNGHFAHLPVYPAPVPVLRIFFHCAYVWNAAESKYYVRFYRVNNYETNIAIANLADYQRQMLTIKTPSVGNAGLWTYTNLDEMLTAQVVAKDVNGPVYLPYQGDYFMSEVYLESGMGQADTPLGWSRVVNEQIEGFQLGNPAQNLIRIREFINANQTPYPWTDAGPLVFSPDKDFVFLKPSQNKEPRYDLHTISDNTWLMLQSINSSMLFGAGQYLPADFGENSMSAGENVLVFYPDLP